MGSPPAGSLRHGGPAVSIPRSVWLAFAAAVLAGTAAAVTLRHRRELTPALRGERVALAQGCLACHGPEGRGGVANPGARSGTVPGWDGPTLATYARDRAEIVEWIMAGKPARIDAGEAQAGRQPLLPMPAYRGQLSARELDDLLAYLQAVSLFDVEIPEPAYEGWKISQRLGCFGCHGPSGIGGMPNPGSFKGHIPPWDGNEFAELVRNEAELREWILAGRPKRLAEHRLARFFLDRQVVQMPGYRAHLSEDEVNKIVAFIQWRRQGAAQQAAAHDDHKVIGWIGFPPARP